MERKGYPAEFRRRALDLVAAGKPVREVVRLLEVSDQSIYVWRRQELSIGVSCRGCALRSGRSLRRRIRELETELVVHRRAADPGGDYSNRRDPERRRKRLVTQLE